MITLDGRIIKYALSEVLKVSMITTDTGPFESDVAVAVFINSEIYIIKSDHPMYDAFLFDELSKNISLDYKEMINASTCTDNAEFILYKK